MSLTPSEQDRQARGRNPYLGNDDDDDDFSDGYSGDGRFDAYVSALSDFLSSFRAIHPLYSIQED